MEVEKIVHKIVKKYVEIPFTVERRVEVDILKSQLDTAGHAVSCGGMQCVAVCCSLFREDTSTLPCNAVSCSAMQCVAVWCSALRKESRGRHSQKSNATLNSLLTMTIEQTFSENA